jgi:hypothetical protein
MTVAIKNRFLESAANQTLSELPLHDLVETKVYSNPFVCENDSHFNESRIKVKYELNNEMKVHFVLFRGLVEFSRSKDFYFVFNRHDNSFVVDVSRNKIVNLKELLSNVSTQLAEELKFRKKLKAAIHFERQYRLQCDALYRTHTLAS